MSEDNQVESTEVKEVQDVRGERGELGQATPSLTIKQMWRSAYAKRVLAPTTQNKRHHVWVPVLHAPSLKVFAKGLAAKGDPVASEWLSNKLGGKNAERSEANVKAARETAAASRLTRRKSGKK
jgi:hypothetical protein